MPFGEPKRGDIYHVNFPTPKGPHYAVIVTDDSINRTSTTIVVAMITSKHMDEIGPHQFRVPKRLMKQPSKVNCKELVSVFKAWLTEDTYAATLDDRDIQGLDSALMKALGLWR